MYSTLVSSYFNIILDISKMKNGEMKFNLFHYLREYFALSSPRAIIYDTETGSSLIAFKLSAERTADLQILLDCESLDWEIQEDNGHHIFIFK